MLLVAASGSMVAGLRGSSPFPSDRDCFDLTQKPGDPRQGQWGQ